MKKKEYSAFGGVKEELVEASEYDRDALLLQAYALIPTSSCSTGGDCTDTYPADYSY